MELKKGDRVLAVTSYDKSPRHSGTVTRFSDGGEYVEVIHDDCKSYKSWDRVGDLRLLESDTAIEKTIAKPAPLPWYTTVLDKIFGSVKEQVDGTKPLDGANGERLPALDTGRDL